MNKIIIGFVVVVVLGLGFWYFNNSSNNNSNNNYSMDDNNATTTPIVTGATVTTTPDSTADQKVILKTNFGDITIAMEAAKSPNTVANFVKLAKSGFYDGILFHRVIKGFMIQAGDPLTKSDPKNWAIHGTGGPGYKFADEVSSTDNIVRGTVAMANAGPNTNGSQFFIVTAPATPSLNGHYSIFGHVTAGMDVVDKIESAQTNENDHPLQDAIIQKAVVE